MPLPTLLTKGNLQAVSKDDDQSHLDNIVPIDHIINWIKQNKDKLNGANPGGLPLSSRVLILMSETGSGKSTVNPAYLYKEFFNGRQNIAITQPRVLTAEKNITEMLSLEVYRKSPFNFKLKQNIGWSTGSSKEKPIKGLISMTIGTLTAQLKVLTDEEFIRKYNIIMIDEVHERDLQTDMTLFLLKQLLLRNKNNVNIPFVLLMSATFDPFKFAKYFQTNSIIKVVGRAFPVQWNFSTKSHENYIEAAVDKVIKLHKAGRKDSQPNNDILVFLPGLGEIKRVAASLHKINDRLYANNEPVMMILQIDSHAKNTENYDYRMMDADPDKLSVVIKSTVVKPFRRVILSTVVAETGLTLSTLKYVIDSGIARKIEYNPVVRSRALLSKPVTKSMVKQRAGRSGRKFPGVFHALYTEDTYKKLQDIQYPTIMTEDISSIMLSIIDGQIKMKELTGKPAEFTMDSIDMLDLPSVDALMTSMETLYALGFITPLRPHDKFNQSDSMNKIEYSDMYLMNTREVKLEASDKIEQDPISQETTRISYGLTNLGKLALKLDGIAPEYIKMVLSAYAWEVSPMDIIDMIIYSETDMKQIRESPMHRVNFRYIADKGLPKHFHRGSASFHTRTRMLIADDLIDGLWFMEAIRKATRVEMKSKYKNIIDFCSNAKIKYSEFIKFLRLRDDYIEKFMSAGINLYNDTLRLVERPPEEFMDGIIKIKHCIYEGLKMSMATLVDNEYKTRHGYTLETPAIIADTDLRAEEKRVFGLSLKKPKRIVYKNVQLKHNKKTNLYKIHASKVSVMDGFIPDCRYAS